MKAATPTQRRVLTFIRDEQDMRGRTPSLREIAAAFAWKSVFAAQRNVDALVKKGLLVKEPKRARGILTK